MSVNNDPFFTVGIPTYNRANFVREAIASVLGQTFQDFELIIADNHSDDHTEEIVASFKDHRIRYFRHKQNNGLIFNFNYVAEEARGRYFVLLQDDDLLCKSFLEHAHQCLSMDESLVMYATPFWRGSVGDKFSAELINTGTLSGPILSENQAVVLNGQEMAVSLLYSHPFRHPSIVLRCSDFKSVGFYNQPIEIISDLLMETKILCLGDMVYDPSYIGSVDRIHGGNASRRMGKKQKYTIRSRRYAHIISILEENDIDWRQISEKQFDAMSFKALVGIFRTFLNRGYVAPAAIVNLAWKKVREKNPKSQLWLWNRLLNKLGPGRLFRFFLLKMRE